MANDVNDVKKKFDKKYDKAIDQMYEYAIKTLGWYQ